jgi:zinc-ribbon domain
MEGSILICPSCGKQNPENARFCYACGAVLAAEGADAYPAPAPAASAQQTETPTGTAETQISQTPYVPPQEQVTQPIPQMAPPPVPQGYPPASYPPTYPPARPSRRGRVRCCAIGCLVVLLVLLIGLPVLHLTVLRPFIEGEIYKQVAKSLEDVGTGEDVYYHSDSEFITERQLNEDAKDAWDYIPGSSDGRLYLHQDQIRLEVKVYGVKVWATADLRVDNRGEFVVKSLKMHWLLHLVFSEGALKRELADYANQKIVRPNRLTVVAFQVTEGKLFIAYEAR